MFKGLKKLSPRNAEQSAHPRLGDTSRKEDFQTYSEEGLLA